MVWHSERSEKSICDTGYRNSDGSSVASHTCAPVPLRSTAGFANSTELFGNDYFEILAL